MMFRKFIALTLVVVGLIFGSYAAIKLLKFQISDTSIKNGPWFFNPFVGSEQASGLTRSAVAVFGFLGMKKEESIYFVAREDSEGEFLTGQCTYKIAGKINEQEVRWWSITVYDRKTDKLIKNSQMRYSFNGDNLKALPDGSFILNVSSQTHSSNWIPVTQESNFDLTLRLYTPSAELISNADSIELPSITREACL